VALFRRIRKREWAAGVAIIFILVAGWGIAYYRDICRLQAARDKLRADYAEMMHDAVREYCILYGQLPETASDVTCGNTTFRRPENTNRLIKLEVCNYSSIRECMLAIEARALNDVLPIKPTELEEWQSEFRRIQDLVDQAGSTESKLRLAIDTDVDFRVGFRHALELWDLDSVSKELLDKYILAAEEVRRLRLNQPTVTQREFLRHGLISHVDPPSQHEIEAAEAIFEEALKLLLDSLDEKPLNRSND